MLKLDSGEVDAANAAALSGKLLQLAGGAVYGEDKQVLRFHERKLDALEDLIEAANGKPLLVAYWYRHDLERIRERFGRPPHRHRAGHRRLERGEDRRRADPPGLGGPWPQPAGGRLDAHLVYADVVPGTVSADERAAVAAGAEKQHGGHPPHHRQGTHDEDVMRALERKDMGQAALIRAVRAQIGGAR